MLAVKASYQIPYKEQVKPYIPEGINEAIIDAEAAVPFVGGYFIANVDRIIEKNKKIKGQNIIIKYDLPHVKAIALAHFNKVFPVPTKKAEIVDFLRLPSNLEKIRNNPIPIPKPEKKSLNPASIVAGTVSATATPVMSPIRGREPGILLTPTVGTPVTAPVTPTRRGVKISPK
ncbi:Hypothetical protein POVR1_LOCUS510 [uncultured virus]|nr:Hypothetical protein POVR1_LOCUS510 [uncultured virus]